MLEDAEELSEETRLHLEEMEDEHLLPDPVDLLRDLYNEDVFQSARDALDLLEDAISDVKDDGWLNVVTQYQYRRIRLKARLQGLDVTGEVKEALEFLEDYHPDVSSNLTIVSVFDLLAIDSDRRSLAQIDTGGTTRDVMDIVFPPKSYPSPFLTLVHYNTIIEILYKPSNRTD